MTAWIRRSNTATSSTHVVSIPSIRIRVVTPLWVTNRPVSPPLATRPPSATATERTGDLWSRAIERSAKPIRKRPSLRADPEFTRGRFRERSHVKLSKPGTNLGPRTVSIDEQAFEIETDGKVGAP